MAGPARGRPGEQGSAVGRAGSALACWAAPRKMLSFSEPRFSRLRNRGCISRLPRGPSRANEFAERPVLGPRRGQRRGEDRSCALGQQHPMWPPPPTPRISPARGRALVQCCPLRCEQDGAGGLLGTRVRAGSGPGRFAVPFLQQKPGLIVVVARPLLPTRMLRALTSF